MGVHPVDGQRMDKWLLLRWKISSPTDVCPLLQFGRPSLSGFSGHDDRLGAEKEPTGRLGCAHNVDDEPCTPDRIARLGSVRPLAHPVELTDSLLIIRSRGVKLHRRALPVRPKSTWFDDDDVNTKRLHFVSEHLGETFNRELRSLVGAHPGVPPTRPPIEENWTKVPDL